MKNTKLLVVVDESPATKRALEYVAQVASRHRDFRVCLAHTLPSLPPELVELRGAQQLSYAAVIFLLALFSIATGVAMSPAVAARFPWYIKIFHGRQGARSLHFLALCTFIVFFIGHVTIVVLHGFRTELAMIVLGETHNPQLTHGWC